MKAQIIKETQKEPCVFGLFQFIDKLPTICYFDAIVKNNSPKKLNEMCDTQYDNLSVKNMENENAQ